MRKSKQRDLILQIVQSTNNHPTADNVYYEARNKMPNISLGTVYRNLGQLVDNNQLKIINVNGVVHYDAFLYNHQHFLCNTCNRVYDIEISTKEFVSEADTRTNHKIDRCQVQLFGVCEKCQNN